MKKILLICIVIICFGFKNETNVGRLPFYEKSAFEFYKTKILAKKAKNKINVYSFLKPTKNNPHWFPYCNEEFCSKFRDQDGLYNLNQNLSRQVKLPLTKIIDKRFKIQPYGKGSFPKLFIDRAFSIKGDHQIMVNIICKVSESKKIVYRFNMHKEGHVIDWCSNSYND